MTFSKEAKKEIQKNNLNLKGCCLEAFLYAVFKATGEYVLTSHGLSLTCESESSDFLEFCQALVKTNYGQAATIKVENTLAMRNSVVYSAEFDSSLLENLHLTYVDSQGLLQLNDRLEEKFVTKTCCKRAFLQGLFLSCGSTVIPRVSEDLATSTLSQSYHLEFVFDNEQFRNFASSILLECGFTLKNAMRKQLFVLYTKSSEAIADMLVFLGAKNAKLQIENVLVERSVRNNANRQSNCIYANIEKMLSANQKQLEAIETLKQKGILQRLPQTLQDAAKLREDNADAPLSELAAMLNISKSGLKHRLNKLIELSGRE